MLPYNIQISFVAFAILKLVSTLKTIITFKPCNTCVCRIMDGDKNDDANDDNVAGT